MWVGFMELEMAGKINGSLVVRCVVMLLTGTEFE